MITKNENGFGWGSLLLAVLFFIAGWTALNNPLTTLIALGLMYGITAIVQGVSVLMYYFELEKVLPGNPWYLILIGVLDLLVGLYLVFNPAVSVIVSADVVCVLVPHRLHHEHLPGLPLEG